MYLVIALEILFLSAGQNNIKLSIHRGVLLTLVEKQEKLRRFGPWEIEGSPALDTEWTYEL